MSHPIKNNANHDADAVKNYYENAKESVKDARDYISDKADTYSKNIQHQFTETEEKLITYTKSNPLKALGFALVIGYIASKIL